MIITNTQKHITQNRIPLLCGNRCNFIFRRVATLVLRPIYFFWRQAAYFLAFHCLQGRFLIARNVCTVNKFPLLSLNRLFLIARLQLYLSNDRYTFFGGKPHSFVKLKLQSSQTALIRVVAVKNQSKLCFLLVYSYIRGLK